MVVRSITGYEQLFVATFTMPGFLAVRTGQLKWRNATGRALTVVAVKGDVGTAPTGATVIVDINKNGTTMFTTQANRPTVATSALVTSTTLPDVTSVADGDLITMDVDQIGSTIIGKDLVVQVVMKG